jgi:hypothetical protein
VGLILAIVASGTLLWLFPESHSVVAYLQVKSTPSALESLDQQQRLTPKDYEIFQQTQLALLKSQLVLHSALSQPEISQLDTVIKKGPDPVAWLQKELRACFPGEGEILEIRYEGKENPEDTKKVLDSVIAAYESEVLHAKAESSHQRIRVMSPATASNNINTTQRYSIASVGGLATLCLTCLGSVLIGCCANMQKNDAKDETH